MGRDFAGILGLLTFAAMLVRGLFRGASVTPTLQAACIVLFVFATIGYLAGKIARSVVEQSVHGRMRSELAADQQDAAGDAV